MSSAKRGRPVLRRPGFWLGLAALMAPSLAVFAAENPQLDTAHAIIHADENPGNWLTYGRTYSEQRFSPLSQINRSNVQGLKLAWYFDLDSNRGQESTPLVVDGVMYVTTNWSRIKALDAATGKLLWAYDPKVPGSVADKGCCDTINRGAAYWNGKVYFGTFDGRLIALDARSGKLAWSVDTIPRDAALGTTRAYTISGAPRIAKGRVIIGNGGAELGARGFVTAFDAQTGKVDWRFFTVPNPKNQPDHAASDSILMSKAYASWSPTGAWISQGGGGTVWDSIVYDPVTDLIYLGVGNGSPWNYKERSNGVGDNLFLGSIVAIKPETGEYVWHFQETPRDQWDYTSVQQIMTLDLLINGKMRHVIAHAPKNGFFYLLDAKTGQFISAKNFVPQNWAKSIDPKTGRPTIEPNALYTLTGKPHLQFPGSLGAHSFMAMAYSPKTNYVYIPAQQAPQLYVADTGAFKQHKVGWNTGDDIAVAGRNAQENKTLADMKGWLIAWDPIRQKAAFTVTHKGPWNGGILATGGDLLFQGLATGEFNAYDATNGKLLFDFHGQGGIIAPPVTYSVRGRQFVSVEVGWGGAYPLANGATSTVSGQTYNHSRVITFALQGAAMLPAANDKGYTPVKPPAHFDAALAAAGSKPYNFYCNVCHGGGAASGGVLPDLRWSGAITTKDGFYNVVGRGALTAYGMDRFDADLSPAEVEKIRQYIIQQANVGYRSGISTPAAKPRRSVSAPK